MDEFKSLVCSERFLVILFSNVICKHILFLLGGEVFPSNLTLLVFLINSDPGFQGPKYSTAIK